MFSKGNYFAILPAPVRYNPNISAKAILLYACLSSLSRADGIAYASDRYLADIFHVSESTVRRLLCELIAQKAITSSYEYNVGTREITRRIIRVVTNFPLLLDLPCEQAYYSVVPSHILTNPDLSAQAKLLYAEISAATPVNGYCSVPSKRFAQILSTSTDSIKRYIRELTAINALHIEMEYVAGKREVKRRRIYLTAASEIVEKRKSLLVPQNSSDEQELDLNDVYGIDEIEELYDIEYDEIVKPIEKNDNTENEIAKECRNVENVETVDIELDEVLDAPTVPATKEPVKDLSKQLKTSKNTKKDRVKQVKQPQKLVKPLKLSQDRRKRIFMSKVACKNIVSNNANSCRFRGVVKFAPTSQNTKTDVKHDAVVSHQRHPKDNEKRYENSS